MKYVLTTLVLVLGLGRVQAQTMVSGNYQQTHAIYATEALGEVNAQRARRGLPPFRECPKLTQAAMCCADYRAQHLLAGHTQNDFYFLPRGGYALAAGCAAWEPALGFGACEMYSTQYRVAGAAWVMGRDGRRYCHLFLR